MTSYMKTNKQTIKQLLSIEETQLCCLLKITQSVSTDKVEQLLSNEGNSIIAQLLLPSTLLDHCLKILHNTVKHMNLPTVV